MPRKLEKKQSAKGRRGNHEGSIYRRTDGRWCAQVVTGYKDDGTPKRKYIYAATRAEAAQKAIGEANHVFETGYINGDANPGSMTVKELAESWLMDFKRFSVSPRTFEWYLNLNKAYLVPVLGAMKVSQVQTIHIQRLLNNLFDNGYSLTTVKKTQGLARQVFAHAVETGLLSDNPASKTKVKRNERKTRTDEMKAIPAEYRSIILEAAATQENIKPIITTLMFSGLRSGELIALKWKHINFDAMTTTVDGAVTVDSKYDREGNCLWHESVLSSAKTISGFRTIQVSSRVMDVLREWREQQAIRGMTAAENFVFPTRTGGIRSYAGLRSLIDRFLTRIGLDEFHPHSFRHTFATILLENNVNPRVVQLYMGHSDVQTTLNIYSSVAAEVFSKAADRMDGVYDALMNRPLDHMASAHTADSV